LGTAPGDRSHPMCEDHSFTSHIAPAQSPSRFLENNKFFAMERSEVHKRPMGEFYNGEADDVHGGNNEGPRKYRGGLFLSHVRTITPTII